MSRFHRQRTRWLSMALLLCLLVLALVLVRRPQALPSLQTGQAPPVVVETVAQRPPPDSPLPTVVIEGTIEPTWTPVPTPLPPPTPTLIPGPTATALPLIPPAPDAAGTILYAVSGAEIKPGYDTSIAIDAVIVDKTGQPQTEPQRLSSDIRLSGIPSLHASPDGSRVLIEDGWGIHSLLHVKSGKVESPFHQNPNPRGTFFGWHPDNRQILIRAEDNYLDPGLWLVNTETGQHTTLLALYGTPSHLIGGSVSPDGQTVVYALKSDFQVPSELWMASTNGANHHRLYTYDGYIVALSWSPDGSKIAFLNDSLTIMNADGTGIRSIGKKVVTGYGFWPMWSPDSKMIAYTGTELVAASGIEMSKDDGQRDSFPTTVIYLVDITTGEEHQLHNGDNMVNIDPAWSPDGTQFAFIASKSGISELWLASRDGSNLRLLSTMNQWVRSLQWIKYQLRVSP